MDMTYLRIAFNPDHPAHKQMVNRSLAIAAVITALIVVFT